MRNTIRIKTAIAATVGAAAAMFATPAVAGTQSSNLGVSATVAANCTISTTALAFGSIDSLSASAVNGTGGVAIACTNGSTWTATADVGAGAGATFAARRMTSGANTLSYSLFTDAGRTTVWGNGTNSTGVITSTGTGSTQNITIYGQIPGSQTGVPAGSYSDTVAVTVTY
ncbi:MAG TPA: spore coat protein U domain-containing protein [Allosphingosinicella sp.]